MRAVIAVYVPENEETGQDSDLILLEGEGDTPTEAVKNAIKNYNDEQDALKKVTE